MESNTSLWPLSDRLHLWSLATARSHALFPHFLSHYAAHGVHLATRAHVVVHEDFAPPATLRRAALALRSVRDVRWQPSVNSSALEGLKLQGLNDFIAKELPAAAWLAVFDTS